MKNPWEEIDLSDYENHMQLGSVMQLQALNEMMRGQLAAYPAASVMILGVAGGNGLEHIRPGQFSRVYGVDVNQAYLQEVAKRYSDLGGVLQCLHVDLLAETAKLPKAELVIANLLIEYIGYDSFQRAVRQVEPEYVSCIIQINEPEGAAAGWVSDSPYLHAFDGLDTVHHQMSEQALAEKLQELGYRLLATGEHPLPNGKKLVQLDFAK